MTHELIKLSQFPTIPAPWSSSDPGEAWIWGDYVMTLQTEPLMLGVMLSKVTGKKDLAPVSMQYPYAMTVFYRKEVNPHGPSGRPILVATLERMDYDAAMKMFGLTDGEMANGTSGNYAPVVKGLFCGGTHSNLGDYEGPISKDGAREYFMDLIRNELNPSGKPVQIGVMNDVHGHPQTGWPAKEKKKSGCLPVLIALMLITPLILVLL
jgi:hypothetical protein